MLLTLELMMFYHRLKIQFWLSKNQEEKQLNFIKWTKMNLNLKYVKVSQYFLDIVLHSLLLSSN